MFSNKTLILIIVGLVVLVGGVLLYLYYPKGEAPVPTTGGQNGQATDQAPSRMKTLSQEPVLGVAVEDRKVKYYLKSNGHVVESDFDGSNSSLFSSSVLLNLLDVSWSPDKNRVIVLFNQGGEIKKGFYDHKTRQSVSLADGLKSFAWSPDSGEIAYQFINSNESNISISNPDGSGWKTIFETKIKDLIVEWPQNSRISIRTRSSGLAPSVVYLIDADNGKFEKIIQETFGLAFLWSPLGNKALYSETDENGKNLKLKVFDVDSRSSKDLNFSTLPEKCAWSKDNKTIFCAVPEEIPSPLILPDDYYKNKISFDDVFWRFNLETGERINILKDKETVAVDAKALLLSPLEDYLLFINQKDGRLYSLSL